MLKISDAIAYALNNASIADHYNNVESRYIDCMKGLFHHDKNGFILNYGIKPVINFEAMDMPDESKSFFRNLRKIDMHSNGIGEVA